MAKQWRSSPAAELLRSPIQIVDQFIVEMKKRCSGFEPISEDDLRYAFLHVLEKLVFTGPQRVRLGYRLYANDRLKLDLVIRDQSDHVMACEFKAHVSQKSPPRRIDAWNILDDLSRLALANVMWKINKEGCPSYFVHLSSDRMSNFLQRNTPRLAKLLDAPIGTLIPFDVHTELEIVRREGDKPQIRRRPTYELDLHSGCAECVGRADVEHDGNRRWSLSIFRISGDKHLAYDY